MTRRTKGTTLPIGTISSGTLRLEDLIPALASELDGLRLTRTERATVREIVRASKYPGYFDAVALTDPSEDYQGLCNIAESHVPDYSYFGSLEGDGAEIGVWPSIDAFDQDVYTSDDPPASTKSSDRSVTLLGQGKFRHNYTGQAYWRYVTDHGNVTLYRRAGRRWVECWSVV